MAIKGSDFILEIEENGQFKPIACSTDFSMPQDFEAKEISGSQGQWRDYIGGYSGYGLSVSGLVMYEEDMNFLQLQTIARTRTKVRWRGGDKLPSGVVDSGVILITNLTKTAQFRDAVKFDMTAVGCGPAETNLLPFTGTVYLADETLERLPGCPNPYPVSVFWYNDSGSAPGVFLGIALNNDDVVTALNEYEENEFFVFSVGVSGCDFNIIADWNAPFMPEVIFAQTEPGLGLSPDQDNNLGLSPDQDNDQQLSPGYA